MNGVITKSRAVERQAAQEAFRGTDHGALMAYSELTAAIGADARSLRHVLHQAMDDLIDEAYIFEVVVNEGYRRMFPAEAAVAVPDRRRRRIHGQARRATRELQSIGSEEIKNLMPLELQSALIGRSLFGAIAAATTTRAIKAIRNAVAEQGYELPVSDTIEALRLIG